MSAVPIVLIGLGLTLLVLSPLLFRATTVGSGARGPGGKRARAKRASRKPRDRDPQSAVRHPQSPDPERQALEDEAARLIEALREVEAERDAGRLAAGDYTALKARYEIEAASVLKQLDATGPPTPGPGPRGVAGVPGGRPGWRRGLVWTGAVVLFLGLAGLALMSSVGPRAEGAPMTGIQLGGEGGPMGGAGEDMMAGLMSAMARAAGGVDSTALPALEARLAADSSDLDALVKAGHLYLAEGRFADAAHVSMQALEIDHGNMEAHAHVALLLVAQGRMDMATEVLRQVLTMRPDYPEALLYQGMVQLSQGGDPTAAWERFLELAPPDANTGRIRNMLAAVKQRQ